MINETVKIVNSELNQRKNIIISDLMNENYTKYLETLDKKLEKLSIENGTFSKSAICLSNRIKYDPNSSFPEFITIGVHQYLDTEKFENINFNTPNLHPFRKIPNLLIESNELSVIYNQMRLIILRLLCSLDLKYCNFVIYDPIDNYKLSALFNFIPHTSIKHYRTKSDFLLFLQEASNELVQYLRDSAEFNYESTIDIVEYNKNITDNLKHKRFNFIFIPFFKKSIEDQHLEEIINLIRNRTLLFNFIIGVEDLKSLLTPSEMGNEHELFNELIQMDSLKHFERFHTQINFEEMIGHSFFANIKRNILQVFDKPFDIDEYIKPGLSSVERIVIPVGHTIEGVFNVAFGVDEKGNDQLNSMIICGASGSGKSVLLHNILVNMTRQYSPDEVKLLLLDLNHGVNFDEYHNIPNTWVLDSKVSVLFGRNVLKYLIKQIEERAEIFKNASVANIVEYRKKNPTAVLPRLILVIDEFQVLLLENDHLSYEIQDDFDSISRRGRMAGIHMILATQSIQGVPIKPSTLLNIPIRIGFRLSESDKSRLFSRSDFDLQNAGEAVYQYSDQFKFFKSYYMKPERKAELQAQLAVREKVSPFIYYSDQNIDPLFQLLEQDVPSKSYLSIYISNYIDVLRNVQIDLGDKLQLVIAAPYFLHNDFIYLRLEQQVKNNYLLLSDNKIDVLANFTNLMFQLSTSALLENIYYINGYDSEVSIDRYPQLAEKVIQVNSEQSVEIDMILGDLLDTIKSREEGEEAHTKQALFVSNLQSIPCMKKSLTDTISTDVSMLLEEIVNRGSAVGIHVFVHLATPKLVRDVFSSTEIFNLFSHALIYSNISLPYGIKVSDSAIKAYFTSNLLDNEFDHVDVTDNARFASCRLFSPQQLLYLFTQSTF